MHGTILSETKSKVKILFVYSVLSSFIRSDLEILERHFNVKNLKIATFLVPRRGRDPLVFLKLGKGILWADVVYSWFADLNSFFLVLFCIVLRKKSIVVVGGHDVVYVPEIDYGDLKSWWGRVRVKFVLEHAAKVLPFSEYANNRVLRLTKKGNISVVPLACNTERFRPSREKKEDLVTTVCLVTKDNVLRKGLKTFVESAKSLSNKKFVIIGPHLDDSVNLLRGMNSQNVEFTGFVSEEDLVKWYQRAKVYCQLSYEEGEGAGGALGEAMACECIPVISEKAVALKEAVGSYGFHVPYGDAKATVKAIESAFQASSEIGVKVRNRMETLFPVKKREEALLRLIQNIA